MSFSKTLMKQQDKTKESYTNSLKKCITHTKPKTYILRGNPTPLQRPKLTSFPYPHAYDPQKQAKAESQIDLRLQHGYSKLTEGPITLEVTFFMPIPASTPKKKKELLLGQPHVKKPDLSNMIKYLEDVSQGILFRDDAIIDKIIARKLYSDIPRTEFTIRKGDDDCQEEK